MTIWILTLLLLGCLAGIGYQQGVIRVAISFIGIIVAALLAGPLAKFVKPAVTAVGVVNPVLVWVLPPFIVFVIVLSLFKIGAYALHHKVDVFYRYKAGDLRFALWERLNARLGLCLGLLNGLAYLVLISMVIYPFSYWTVQLASPDSEPKLLRLFNRLGRDLQGTGMVRVARAIDPMPDVFYSAADAAGLLYQNPLLQARLSRYPAFLSLAEKQEFRAIAEDKTLIAAFLEQKRIWEILKYPSVQPIVANPDMLRYIWSIFAPDVDDLIKFLDKGTSAKYTEGILGRWEFDPSGTMAAYLRARTSPPPSSTVAKIRNQITTAYARTVLVASPDHQAVLKNLPQPRVQPGPPPTVTVELKTFDGKWKGKDGEYELSLGGAGDRKATLEADRLTLTGDSIPMVFTPED